MTDSNILSPELLEQIFRINPEPMTLTHLATGRYIAVNDSFLNTFGYTRGEVVGRTANELNIWVNPDRDRSPIVNKISELGYVSDVEAEFRTKTGESIVFSLGAIRFDSEDGALLLIVGRNVTDLRNSEAALRASEARYRGLIENLPIGVLIAQDGLVRYANPASLEMIDHRSEEVLGKPFQNFVQAADREMVMAIHQQRMQGDDSACCYDVQVLRNGGEICYWRVHASSDVWDGRVASLAVCADITQQKLAEQRMADLALYDQVTNLPNRMSLTEHACQAMGSSPKGFAVLYLDLDGFKVVNDRFGHNAGDQVLKEVATRLRRSIRETDIAARVGGDEFVVLLLNLDNYPRAKRVAEYIREALNRPIPAANEEHQIGASIGVSLYPQDGVGFEQLLHHADEAMYRAKRMGRNGICCYNEIGAKED